jgi:hypothetical protein
MYAALEVHTTETIADGRKELLKFASLIKVSLVYNLLNLSIEILEICQCHSRVF